MVYEHMGKLEYDFGSQGRVSGGAIIMRLLDHIRVFLCFLFLFFAWNLMHPVGGYAQVKIEPTFKKVVTCSYRQIPRTYTYYYTRYVPYKRCSYSSYSKKQYCYTSYRTERIPYTRTYYTYQQVCQQKVISGVKVVPDYKPTRDIATDFSQSSIQSELISRSHHEIFSTQQKDLSSARVSSSFKSRKERVVRSIYLEATPVGPLPSR